MTDAISPFKLSIAAHMNAGNTGASQTKNAAENPNAKGRAPDIVDISTEAIIKQDEESKKPQESDFRWKMMGGLEEGEFKLKNGNRQVVSIDGSKLTIEEFDGNKLVRRVNGVLGNDGAVMESEIYDENGKISQKMLTEFAGLSSGEKSSAVVKRSVEWFKNGERIRTMQDSMKLDSRYVTPQKAISESLLSYGTEGLSGDIKPLMRPPTTDYHSTYYSAQITEFESGVRTREAHIEHKGTFVNRTNRSNTKTNDLDERASAELMQNSLLEMDIINYDSKGDILMQASWEDNYYNSKGNPNGTLEQKLNISWYNQGKIVKRENSYMKVEETEQSALPKRPQLLEILNLSTNEYSSDSPKSASQLMADPLMESSGKAGFYSEGTKKHVAKGHYKTSEIVEKNKVADRPYEMRHTNEVYKEGELVARQKDTESARKNPLPKGLEFWTGTGLTESESPSTIKSASHVDESYENGRLKNKATIDIYEHITPVDRGPDTISSSVVASQTRGIESTGISNEFKGGIENADTDLHAASKSIADQEDMIAKDMFTLLNSLDRDNPSPAQEEYRVGLETDY